MANLMKLILVSGLLLVAGCSSPTSSEDTPTPGDGFLYRYFDRTLHLPQGVDITPEKSLAQVIIQDTLVELASKTDLGQDFFTFAKEESSLLQPVLEDQRRAGTLWQSFIQVYEDGEFNDLVATSIGNVVDEDVVVARNSNNLQQYYIITRLACFVAGDSCGFASQQQAKVIILRAYGYLIGLKFGENANTAVMEPGISPKQSSPEALIQFYSDFNARLEKIRYDSATPR